MKEKINNYLHPIIIESRDISMLGALLIREHLEIHEVIDDCKNELSNMDFRDPEITNKSNDIDTIQLNIESSARLIVMFALSINMSFEELMKRMDRDCPCIGLPWILTSAQMEKMNER